MIDPNFLDDPTVDLGTKLQYYVGKTIEEIVYFGDDGMLGIGFVGGDTLSLAIVRADRSAPFHRKR